MYEFTYLCTRSPALSLRLTCLPILELVATNASRPGWNILPIRKNYDGY
ncbi:hypothetical protein CEXT_149061, partial [Caerostris extrusa]